jgi:hypothetical protein
VCSTVVAWAAALPTAITPHAPSIVTRPAIFLLTGFLSIEGNEDPDAAEADARNLRTSNLRFALTT